MDVDVGKVVAGKYELVRLLGHGSMGEVWAAHHRTLGEQVALKLLTPLERRDRGEEADLEGRETVVARFLLEAQVAARLSRRTRHIVRVTDHGEDGSLAYLVMELLEGETLERALTREGRLEPKAAVAVVTQVARALAQAHAEGVLHRDLKPANVFMTRDEDGELLVKLLDFGIARAASTIGPRAYTAPAARTTAKGIVFGTPGYMSPEQARASSKLDHHCDLWALATLAYEALTGELPVAGRDTDELLQQTCAGRIVPIGLRDPHLPPGLGDFFERALAESVTSRFQNATDLAQAFAAAIQPAGPAEAMGAELPDFHGRTRRRRWLWGAAIGSVIAAGVAVVGLASSHAPAARPPARADSLTATPATGAAAPSHAEAAPTPPLSQDSTGAGPTPPSHVSYAAPALSASALPNPPRRRRHVHEGARPAPSAAAPRLPSPHRVSPRSPATPSPEPPPSSLAPPSLAPPKKIDKSEVL